MALTIKSRHEVKPASLTQNCILPLTQLDQVGTITHTSIIYFYENPAQTWLDPTTHKIFDTLKDSLSSALVPFYPLAGRLSWLGGGRLELDCNAMGAELIEAESTKGLIDFGDFSTPKMFRDFLPRMNYSKRSIQEIPLLAVQITKFGCGGISIGVSASHVVLDGKSLLHFIKEWARLARGEPIEVAPSHDRQVLGAENGDRAQDGRIVRKYLEESKGGEHVAPTFVVLTKEQIEKLKKIANNELAKNYGKRWYGSFEVVAAHVWRSICKARDLNDNQTTSLTVTVDARGRMNPPLPSSYFGNAIVDAETTIQVSELISKPLSYACGKLREAIINVTSEHVYTTIDFLKNQQNLSDYQLIDDRGCIEGVAIGNQNVTVVSWLNLPARGIDFGWGNEVYVGCPLGYARDGDSLIFPHKNYDGSVVVAACIQPKEKFLQYVVDF